MGAGNGRNQDTNRYYKDYDHYRSTFNTPGSSHRDSFGRKRSDEYDGSRRGDWRSRILQDDVRYPYRDSTRSDRYNRKAYSDDISNASIIEETKEWTDSPIRVDREMFTNEPAYPKETMRTSEVQRVSVEPPRMAEVREIEVPAEVYVTEQPRQYEVVETPRNIQKEVVYVQSERPTQTERIYETRETPGYVSSRYVDSNPLPVARTSNIVYSQPQPRASRVVQEIVPAQQYASERVRPTTEIIRRSGDRDRGMRYNSGYERRISEPRQSKPHTIVYNVDDGHHVESFDVVDSGNKKTFHSGYSGFLSENNFLGSRNEEGGMNTLFRSRRD